MKGPDDCAATGTRLICDRKGSGDRIAMARSRVAKLVAAFGQVGLRWRQDGDCPVENSIVVFIALSHFISVINSVTEIMGSGHGGRINRDAWTQRHRSIGGAPA